jgi:hypothetical protein
LYIGMKARSLGRLGAPLVVGVIGLFAGCSASDGASGFEGGGATSSGGSANASGTGASGGSGGSGNSGNGASGGFDTDSGTGGGGGIGETCAGDLQKGELIPLDMYVMMDISGSMLATASGVTKWDAVKQATTAFLNDPQSEGIGVGIQYFPLRKDGVPESCTTDAECGDGAPCFTHVCWNLLASGQVRYCTRNQDCGLFGQCVEFGECQNDPNFTCQQIGGNCSGPGGPGGACVKPASSFCLNATTCDTAKYAAPAVDIGVLPGAAQPIIDSLAAQNPTGNTPTSAALEGAIGHARAYATANSERFIAAGRGASLATAS